MIIAVEFYHVINVLFTMTDYIIAHMIRISLFVNSSPAYRGWRLLDNFS